MAKEVLTKTSYKIDLFILKLIPMILLSFNLSNTILSYFGFDFNFISYISGIGFIPIIFLYRASYMFKFCEYHRLPLHYVVITNSINCIDYEYGIPISNKSLFIMKIALVGITIFLIIYLKFKVCKTH